MENSKEHCQKGVWQKFNIQGDLLSTANDLDGLVGLEIMETYDNPLLINGTKNNFRKNVLKDTKHAKKKICPGRYVLIANKFKETSNNISTKINDDKICSSTDYMNKWNGLGVPDIILKSLKEMNFNCPTRIQALTLKSAIFSRKDILGAAETGSGKTLAFGIPILAGILQLKANSLKSHKNLTLSTSPQDLTKNNSEPNEFIIVPKDKIMHPLYAVVLTPTRELAVQVKDHFSVAAKYTGITIAAIYGGMSLLKQERILTKCPEIVIATPGRLWELLEKGNPHLNKIDSINYFAIDETDIMLETGHFQELKMLILRLNTNKSYIDFRQHFIFSATLISDNHSSTNTQGTLRKKKKQSIHQSLFINNIVAELGISNPEIVDITSFNRTPATLTESQIVCKTNDKDYYLYYILQKFPGRTIVFCNSIDCVRKLTALLKILQCNPLPLHSQMMQKHRLNTLEKFREGSTALLVSTDVAARGLDIINVHHIVHYQIPRTSDNYIHRSGRTARADNVGISIVLIEPYETLRYSNICKTLNKTEKVPSFPVCKLFIKSIKERVNLAKEIQTMDLRLKKSRTEAGWLRKAADEMEIILENFPNKDHEHNWKQQRYACNKKKALARLLSKPLFSEIYDYGSRTENVADEYINNKAVFAVKDSIITEKYLRGDNQN